MKKQSKVYNIQDLRNKKHEPTEFLSAPSERQIIGLRSLIDRCESRGVLEELPPIYARVLARFERGESLSGNSLILLRTKLRQLLGEVKS